MAIVLDTGALIACQRGSTFVIGLLAAAHQQNVPVRTSAAVVAQVWRGGPRQALLARALTGTTEASLDPAQARTIGVLLGATGVSDVVDAAVVDIADDGDTIVTGDPTDIVALALGTGRTLRIVPI
jgi:hypothetical protein